MSKIRLYIAASLDGYIARPHGSLDWLYAVPNPDNIDHGYKALLDSVENIIMGSTTYKQIIDFGIEWPYVDYDTYVFTKQRNLQISSENTFLVHTSPEVLVSNLVHCEEDTWLVGGGKLITSFLNAQLIDEMIITQVPIILGSGIPLFPNHPQESHWKITRVEHFKTGLLGVTYKKK